MWCEAKNLQFNDVLEADSSPYHAVLTEKEQEALSIYEETWPQRCYNLAQNPLKRPIVSAHPSGTHSTHKLPTMFCLIHSGGLVWMPSVNRFLAPLELAVINGLDTRLSRPDGVPVTTPLSLPREACSRTAMAGQIGNCMNTNVVGSML